jgi:hypothetical protein
MSVELIPADQKKARKLSPEQKLQILREWEQSGNGVEVAQKHQIHPKPYTDGKGPWNRVPRPI